MSLNDDRIGEILGRLASLEQRVQSLEDRPTALVPQAPQVVEVPAFEEKKVQSLENRLSTALARIDELEDRPVFSSSELENIRRAISGRIQELIKDEVHTALAQHVAIAELRETVDRVSRETAPSQIMQTISKVSHDVANLHASTADTLQVVEAVVAETREQMHTCMAEALAAVSQEMERARDGFRADLTTRIDAAFRQSA